MEAEERISELEDKPFGIIQSEVKKEKSMKRVNKAQET